MDLLIHLLVYPLTFDHRGGERPEKWSGDYSRGAELCKRDLHCLKLDVYLMEIDIYWQKINFFTNIKSFEMIIFCSFAFQIFKKGGTNMTKIYVQRIEILV
jgi:hypothetical protein